jgi:hypothetical protein
MNLTRRRWLGTLSLAVVMGTVNPPAKAAQQLGVDLKAFVGSWTQNPAKSRGTISKDLTYAFSQEADGFIVIVRGLVQLRDRVRFDGNDYPTPDIPGRTTSWTRVSDTIHETTIKNGGVLVARGKWTLSTDGKRLTQATTRTQPQADTNIIEYIRTPGSGNSLIGGWEPVSSTSSVAESFVVTLSDATTLSVSFRTGVSYTMRPDGQEYDARSDPFPDMKAVVISLESRALQRTTFRGSRPMLEAVWTLSSDGRTLTVTSRTVGSSDEPSVFVYERQE